MVEIIFCFYTEPIKRTKAIGKGIPSNKIKRKCNFLHQNHKEQPTYVLTEFNLIN